MNPHDRIRIDMPRTERYHPLAKPSLSDRAGELLQQYVGVAIFAVCLVTVAGIVALGLLNLALGCSTGEEPECISLTQGLKDLAEGWQIVRDASQP